MANSLPVLYFLGSQELSVTFHYCELSFIKLKINYVGSVEDIMLEIIINCTQRWSEVDLHIAVDISSFHYSTNQYLWDLNEFIIINKCFQLKIQFWIIKLKARSYFINFKSAKRFKISILSHAMLRRILISNYGRIRLIHNLIRSLWKQLIGWNVSSQISKNCVVFVFPLALRQSLKKKRNFLH